MKSSRQAPPQRKTTHPHHSNISHQRCTYHIISVQCKRLRGKRPAGRRGGGQTITKAPQHCHLARHLHICMPTPCLAEPSQAKPERPAQGCTRCPNHINAQTKRARRPSNEPEPPRRPSNKPPVRTRNWSIYAPAAPAAATCVPPDPHQFAGCEFHSWQFFEALWGGENSSGSSGRFYSVHLWSLASAMHAGGSFRALSFDSSGSRWGV